MAATLKEGDRVVIADRPATADDAKSGLYQGHFRGLIGVVQKVYSTNEAAVEIDQATLTDAIASRHVEMQEQMKNKWLDGLSDEARNRLTPKERDFKLRYTVLVATADLKPA